MKVQGRIGYAWEEKNLRAIRGKYSQSPSWMCLGGFSYSSSPSYSQRLGVICSWSFKPEKRLPMRCMRKTQRLPAHEQAVKSCLLSPRKGCVKPHRSCKSPGVARSLFGGEQWDARAGRAQWGGFIEMPRDCSHHIHQAGGCQAQHGHAGPTEGSAGVWLALPGICSQPIIASSHLRAGEERQVFWAPR